MEGAPPDTPPPPPPPSSVPIVKLKVVGKKEAFVSDTSKTFSSHWSLGGWRREKEKRGPCLLPDSLRIVSFNVYFGKLEREERALALFEHVLRYDPDIIAFQECTLEFIKLVKECTAFRKSYSLCPDSGFSAAAGCWYGVCFLVKSSLRFATVIHTTLPSGMGRTLLSLQFEDGFVSTGHFESLANATLRRQQLEIAADLAGKEKFHLICGDFNMKEDENKSIPAGYVDGWTSLYPNDQGEKEDEQKKRRIRCFKKKKKRFDLDHRQCYHFD